MILILSKLVQATQRKLPPLHFALLATLSVAAGPPAGKTKERKRHGGREREREDSTRQLQRVGETCATTVTLV